MLEVPHGSAEASLNPSGSITPASEYSRSYTGSSHTSGDDSGAGHHSGTRVDLEHLEVYRLIASAALADVYMT